MQLKEEINELKNQLLNKNSLRQKSLAPDQLNGIVEKVLSSMGNSHQPKDRQVSMFLE